ncbi:hypothetical protein MHT86_06240 [Corynebacterium mastitidis]|uniref:hypothetical protein n=1 Tax=Corynebacterium mastitidis TaxID=161890 RepID=UPI001F12CFA6|nr:hypothetical protein [Corynebacterium mastitidis]MCH6197094.1 hypothetical protein [Corynebacterium mastitidis]
MDFLLQIQEFVEGPIGDLLVQLRTGGIQFPELPALPNISLTPQLTLPENIEVGDLGSTFGDFSPADMSSGDNQLSTDFLGDFSELSSGDNGSSNFLSELSSGDNQLSTDFLGDFSELSSGDNGSTDFLGDFSELSSGDNGSTDFLGDFSELSSGDNGSTDLADLSQLSGENGSSDILDLDLSDLLDLNGELNLPDIPQSI